MSAMNSSAFLMKRALRNSSDQESTWTSAVIQKLQSVLDLMVMVRLISKKNQQWLLTTMVESSALLPAISTFFMPSYFTNYGVIYVSLVVPAGYSISSCNAIRNSNERIEAMMTEMNDASRYLKFWVVHAAVTLLLAWADPLLAWVPLSTHGTWLVWAYVQLESSTLRMYGWFENEFQKESWEDTVVVRSARRLVSALPSNVKDSAHESEEADGPAAEDKKSKVE